MVGSCLGGRLGVEPKSLALLQSEEFQCSTVELPSYGGELWGNKKLIRSDGSLSLLWAVYEQTSRLLRQRLVKMNESLLFVLFRLPVGDTSASSIYYSMRPPLSSVVAAAFIPA